MVEGLGEASPDRDRVPIRLGLELAAGAMEELALAALVPPALVGAVGEPVPVRAALPVCAGVGVGVSERDSERVVGVPVNEALPMAGALELETLAGAEELEALAGRPELEDVLELEEPTGPLELEALAGALELEALAGAEEELLALAGGTPDGVAAGAAEALADEAALGDGVRARAYTATLSMRRVPSGPYWEPSAAATYPVVPGAKTATREKQRAGAFTTTAASFAPSSEML